MGTGTQQNTFLLNRIGEITIREAEKQDANRNRTAKEKVDYENQRRQQRRKNYGQYMFNSLGQYIILQLRCKLPVKGRFDKNDQKTELQIMYLYKFWNCQTKHKLPRMGWYMSSKF